MGARRAVQRAARLCSAALFTPVARLEAGFLNRTTGHAMNHQSIEGSWMQMRGRIREQWGKLTDDDLDVIAGKRDQLVGKIKDLYGKTAEEVDREVANFEDWYHRAD